MAFDATAVAPMVTWGTSPEHAAPITGRGKRQAEQEGLDRVFRAAAVAWREAGCSLGTAINGDQRQLRERCASTPNRNFRGRQGPEGRTHLLSPAMAVAAVLTGHLADVRDWLM